MGDAMTEAKSYSEGGFTLIELLVAVVILAVLSGLSMQAYNIYKKDAYHKIAMQIMHQARIALEAGRTDSDSFPAGLLICDQKTAGPAINGDGELLVPGLTLPADFYVRVSHNSGCDFSGCLEDTVITRHCKADQRVIYWKIRDVGEITIYNAAAGDSC
jgi:prepilin-type N-terminal cleavage/methylation domain-containing protein